MGVVLSDRDLEFVVHKHKATALHYDFRLEINGVMPSWSIPKGPTLDSKVKRLAMVTEDHDLEYRHFEGRVPNEKYGAGIVMIWDLGTYRPEVEEKKGVRREITDVKEAQDIAARELKEGILKFQLYGKKLHGSFALVRTKGIRGKEAWLLIKHHDSYCKEGYNANDYDYSEVSGRSMKEISNEND